MDYTPVYFEHFFRNLLLGESNELRNRFFVLNPPEKSINQPPSCTPLSFFATENENILRLVKAVGKERMSVKEMLQAVELKDRMNFLEYSLNPAIKDGFVAMLYPDKPRHPGQKYLLTVKGLVLYNELVGELDVMSSSYQFLLFVSKCQFANNCPCGYSCCS